MHKMSLCRKVLCIALTIAMLCTLIVPAAYAETFSSGGSAQQQSKEAVPSDAAQSRESESVEAERDEHSLADIVRVSIELDAPGTLDAGYAMDRIASNAAAKSYRESLISNQNAVASRIRSASACP